MGMGWGVQEITCVVQEIMTGVHEITRNDHDITRMVHEIMQLDLCEVVSTRTHQKMPSGNCVESFLRTLREIVPRMTAGFLADDRCSR